MSQAREYHHLHAENPAGDWLSNSRSTLLVVVTLITALSFQAGMNPPGGFWQDDSPGCKGGQVPPLHPAPLSPLASGPASPPPEFVAVPAEGRLVPPPAPFASPVSGPVSPPSEFVGVPVGARRYSSWSSPAHSLKPAALPPAGACQCPSPELVGATLCSNPDSDDSKTHTAGDAIMKQKNPKRYAAFYAASWVCFSSSLLLVVWLLTGLFSPKSCWFKGCFVVCIAALVFLYHASQTNAHLPWSFTVMALAFVYTGAAVYLSKKKKWDIALESTPSGQDANV